MSTAKMVADSTVSSVSPKERRKRRKSSESRRSKKHKESRSKKCRNEITLEDSDSDLDLSKDLLSIGGYVKDRPEMLEQMFRAVQGSSLQRALPEILVDLPVSELKQRCLEQLEIMSRKRILRILSGDIPAEISSSGTEETSGEGDNGEEVEEHGSEASSGQELVEKGSEEGVDELVESEVEVAEKEDASEDEAGQTSEVDSEAESEKQDEATGSDTDQQEEEGSAVEGGLESEDAEAREDQDEQDKSKDSVASKWKPERVGSDGSESETSITAVATKDDAPDESGYKSPEISSMVKEGSPALRAPSLTKEQMEILELEMRARAIKAMLNKHPPTLVPLLPSTSSKLPAETGNWKRAANSSAASAESKLKHSKQVESAKPKGSKYIKSMTNKLKGTSDTVTTSSSEASTLRYPTKSSGDHHEDVSKNDDSREVVSKNADSCQVLSKTSDSNEVVSKIVDYNQIVSKNVDSVQVPSKNAASPQRVFKKADSSQVVQVFKVSDSQQALSKIKNSDQEVFKTEETCGKVQSIDKLETKECAVSLNDENADNVM